MTDEIDNILAGLGDEPAEEKPKAAKPARKRQKAARSSSAKQVDVEPAGARRKTGESEQRGRRASPDMVQINAVVRADLHPTLFFLLKQENLRRRQTKEAPLSVSKLVEELLEEWIQKRGGKIEL